MSFSHIVTAFFTSYLAAERGLTRNTIVSYSEVMKLLLNFACERFGLEPERLRLEQFDRDLIVDFLDYLENTRGNLPATRNQRLTVIKTFFHFLARNVPELMHLSETIQAIRAKETHRQPPPSLTMAEVNAILAVPDPDRLLGARDRALVELLYTSGARVQEVADLNVGHIRADICPTVTLTGKGGKTRVIPLRPQTLAAINHYLTLRQRAGIESERLFVNVKTQPLTRFGIGRRVQKLAQKAARDCPTLRDRPVTPHVFRHTTALHLLEAGNDIAVVRDWLGHADIKTTSDYLQVSLQRKGEALDKFPPPAGGQAAEPPQWQEPALLAFLTRLSRGVMLPTAGAKPPSPQTARSAYAT
jgi:site-specific recombinase XerD